MHRSERLSVGLILPHGEFSVQNLPMASFLEDFPDAFRPWMIPSCGLLTVAALSPDYVDCEYVDETVVAGEAEGTWRQFVSDFRAGRPKSVYRNFALDQIDLSASPVPRYDLLGDDYFSLGRGYRMLPVQTTRGCPRSCDFCSVPQITGDAIYEPALMTGAEIEADLAQMHRRLFDPAIIARRRGYYRRVLRSLPGRYEADPIRLGVENLKPRFSMS